jgi:hypothetical protein
MSVVDVTATGKTRPDWRAIRYEYETTTVSQRTLAKKHGISPSTLMKRAMRENWKQKAQLARANITKLEAIIEERANAKAIEELAPFIEEHKTRITKRGVEMSNAGLDRLERLWLKIKPDSSKTEAEGAKTLQTLIAVARTSLGMGDNTGAIGNLNVQILTNQAQIAVATQ